MYDFPSSSFNEIFRSGTHVGGSLNSTQRRGYNSAERPAIITRTLPPVTCRRLHFCEAQIHGPLFMHC